MPTQRQMETDIRHAIEDEEDAHRSAPVIDPTKNVLDLVEAESRYQNGMRDQSEKFQNAIRDAENRRLEAENRRLEDLSAAESKRLENLANSETQRVNDLEAQRVRYEARIAEDLRVNVKTTSDQLAGQLIKETGALNNQILTLTTSVGNQMTTLTTSLTNQMSGILTGINPRIAELERFRWETGGKSAVADPALAAALIEMAQSIAKLKDTTTIVTGRDAEKDSSIKSVTLVVAIIVGAFSVLVGISSVVLGIIVFFNTHH